MKPRKFGIALVGSLCLIAISTIALAQDRQKTTFDYTTDKDWLGPLVHVILHGGGTGTFAFDTGTNYNVISDTLANTLDLRMGPAVNTDGSPMLENGEPVQAAITPLLVGSYLQQDTLFLLIKASRMQPLSKKLDGFLGWLFMHESAVLFDFQKHEITLWSPGNLPSQDLKESGMENAVVLDQVKPEIWGSFQVTVRLNDRTNVDLKIDTGSDETRIPTQVAHQLKLLPIHRNIPYRSAYGAIRSDGARIDSLAFGPIVIRNQEVYYATRQDMHIPNQLGLDILSHFRMLIDFSAKKVYLKPAPEDSFASKGSKDTNNHKQGH